MADGGGLVQIKYLVASKCYRYSTKVELLLEEGYFTTQDIEICILTGNVQKVERDEQGVSVGNKKYIVIGKDTHGYDFYTCGKIMEAEDGKIYFFITVHQCE